MVTHTEMVMENIQGVMKEALGAWRVELLGEEEECVEVSVLWAELHLPSSLGVWSRGHRTDWSLQERVGKGSRWVVETEGGEDVTMKEVGLGH